MAAVRKAAKKATKTASRRAHVPGLGRNGRTPNEVRLNGMAQRPERTRAPQSGVPGHPNVNRTRYDNIKAAVVEATREYRRNGIHDYASRDDRAANLILGTRPARFDDGRERRWVDVTEDGFVVFVEFRLTHPQLGDYVLRASRSFGTARYTREPFTILDGEP